MNNHAFPFSGYRSAGFAIPSAIFLVVILALLASFLVRLSTLQGVTSTQDIQSTRAYHAARAGMDWALFAVLDPQGRTVTAMGPTLNNWPNHPVCPAISFPTATIAKSLPGFSVSVSCTAGTLPAATEGQTSGALDTIAGTGCAPSETAPACALKSIQFYTLTATASAGTLGTPSYVERSITSTVSYCRTKKWATNFVCM